MTANLSPHRISPKAETQNEWEQVVATTPWQQYAAKIQFHSFRRLRLFPFPQYEPTLAVTTEPRASAHTFIDKLKKNCHPAKNAPLFVKRKQNPIRVFVRGPVQILKKRRSTPRLFTRPRTKFRETAFFSILLWTKFLRGDSSSLTCV